MTIYSPLLAPHILARRLQSGRACITELGLEQRCPRCGERCLRALQLVQGVPQ
ncbi:hypothetical protein ACE1BS_19025 [Aeromonas jandaei]